MAAASVNTHVLGKETMNYTQLCRLLVVGGSQVLRETFDRIHPPEKLHCTLSRHPVRDFLESLCRGDQRIISREQWRSLYPPTPSIVSSQHFDITLLTVLLRHIPGLTPPAAGWNSPSTETYTSTEAGINRLTVLRNEVYRHGVEALADDLMFDRYWQDIQQALMRLGGECDGPRIDKVECVDSGIGRYYREILQQWIEVEGKIDQIKGNTGCLYAEAEDISYLERSDHFESTSEHWTTVAMRPLTNHLLSLRKPKACVFSRTAEPGTKEINSHEVSAENGVNRITPETFHTDETRRVYETVMAQLDKAINLQQSDHVAGARKKLKDVFDKVRELPTRFFTSPTSDGLRVLRRGKELFLEDRVCCSVKHGTLLLDTSNPGPQFYSSLLNVIGTFAEVIAEFEIARETFSLLTNFHQRSALTSRKRDLGAAYNNTGCMLLMLGELEQAECNFKTSLDYLESAKHRHQLHSPLLEMMSIAVNSNIARLYQVSRHYSKALQKQEQLVESCKAKEVKELPLQVVFTLLNNLAVLYTTLGKFSEAEQELKWMISYCYKMDREDCDFLLNFVALHLSKVFLSHGKPKEAEKVFRLDDNIDFADMFGGLHINVRIETVETLVDVMVLKGKIRYALELLDRGVNRLKAIFGPDHLNVALLLYKQGKALTLAGEVSIAAAKFKCSINIFEEIFGIKHPLLLKSYMSVGELALRSKKTDDSYFYFQRAMENIEAIYQVSFVDQLSKTYLEVTNSNTFHQSKMLEDAWKIEGLVAEYGVVLAVLLSRPIVQDDSLPLRTPRFPLKQSRRTNNRDMDVPCPDSKEIVSFKYTSDFLKTGQIFLRQRMEKEAAAFFQQARRYSSALDANRGPAYACIARLYDVLTKKRLGDRETVESKREISNCFEELNEVSANISNESSSKRSNEGTTTVVATATATTTTATFDDQLDIKLVLIFLILLSIEMKMIDTTFAAYDLYSRISQNEDGFLHVLNGEVQVYASRTSITCNGKTALQDVLVSSTFSLHETDSQRLLPEDELYRSLAFKKNVPTDSFLVAYTSSLFLDIEELQVLDRNVSRSVQECFQQKCFETGVEDSATQVVVDLTTTTSTCDHHNVLLTISRMKLLSLCLLQGATCRIPQGGDISEISTAMGQKTIHVTFEDEHTSYFMFSKSVIYLVQQCSSGKISTLSVEHHCLSLMITHPVKARVTLWRKDRSISLNVQLVQTTTSHGMAGCKVPRQMCSAELVGDLAVAESIFLPAINHLANAYQVPCTTDAECSDEPPDVSDVRCEQLGFLLDGRQPNEINFVSLRMEKSETLRDDLNAILLENLTIISELSSQLHENIIQGGNDLAVEAHREDMSRLPTSSPGQFEQEVTASDCNLQPSTLNPEANIQSWHSKLEAPNLDGEEETPETRETYPMPREEEDDNLLGRSLFEKDRDSRRSLITELHHEVTRKSNLMNGQDGTSDEVTRQVGNRGIDAENAGTCYTATSSNKLTRTHITNSTFEIRTFNPKAELRAPHLMEPRSKLDDEDALERHLIEKDRKSTGASIAKLRGQKMEEILCTWSDGTDTNEDFAKDQGLFENQQFESSPGNVPGQSSKEEVKRRLIDADMDESVTQDETENVALDNQWQPNSLSSTRGQTQHLQDVTQRQTKQTILKEEKDETTTPIEIGEEYIFPRRDKRESCDGQNKPLENEQFSQTFTLANVTERETSRSSFNGYDEIAPDGPMGTLHEIHNSSIDLVASRNRDVVDGPLKRVGNNLQIQSGLVSENADGMLTSRRQIVDETYCEEVHRSTRRNEKLRSSQQIGKDTGFRNSQLAFLGGEVLVDGDATNSLPEVNSPALTGEAFMTFQDGTERISENEMRPFSSNVARDEFDGRVYSPKSDANVNDSPGFGGARPKEITRNSTRRSSLSKTKNSDSILSYEHKETGEIGLKPVFLARHTVKSNGATLDLPPQDGWDDPYFSARTCENITYEDNLRLPGKGINPPGYTLSPSSRGLYEQAAFAVKTSTRGNAQSLAIHQKRSLDQKEGWHFPPLEIPIGDQGSCASQQNASKSENSSISTVKALFGSRGSRSSYEEMDSMVSEYHNSMGNADNRMVKSPAVRDGHHSSYEDSTSSLLGSLQQIMSTTVNLIASNNAVVKQPQNDPKEAVKLSIQEEARGGREQEQAVRAGVEDSRNQGESTQDNEETEGQHIPTPVQETPRPVCSHYQRRCLVRFSCCGKFYTCHRCHNESKDCSNDQARATNATHIRCSICYHEQEIDEQSQNCGGCKSKMSEYFCATCKHFTSVDKNPFHCDKCGICRIHRDRSFHCDVCNVCLDKRLQGKHKCRADSGHDECCICLEDAFSGCQILPCSHKVHRDCAIAMIQNGVRSCPVCRHPLFSQPQNSPQ